MQLTKYFDYGLRQLDMLDDKSEDSTGLLFIDDISRKSFYERIVAEKAKKYGADGVYLRRFQNERVPSPQIYIFDFTQEEIDDDEIAELHRKLWNACQVPLFFIFTKTEIKIFNCLKSPKFDPEYAKFTTSPMEIVKLAAEIEDHLNERKRKEFSARKFDNGSFWDTSKYKDQFKLDDSSYESLLKYLKKIRADILKKNILEEPIIQRLLVISILVKYLEERIDNDGNTVFPDDFFPRFAGGAKCFTDVLKTEGACLTLFDDLGKHFNGEIFKWEDERERELLARTDLTQFARFLEARTDISGQGTLWPIYSFNDLPIELISNIYEEFLGKKTGEGVVYTPPYLVHFLVDEVMPLDSPVEDFKILDPACGSGVFLVAAYQRVIDWWRIRNEWRKPDSETMKKLLRNSIFGIDISSEAVRLTIFSLSLVLLDATSPKEIWANLKFDNLKDQGNLFDRDFFELIKKRKLEEKFDLVIGNPPFVAKLDTPAAVAIETERRTHRVKLPDNQLALLFWEQSLTVCKPGGLVSLVLPSEPFLYNHRSFQFRKYLLQSCNVQEILDFTPLREVLFGSVNASVSVVLARKETPEGKRILHAVLRRTKISKEKIYLELDHYDLHYVDYREALNNPLVWKANFLGGGRLKNLIARFEKFRKFGTYLEEKRNNYGWCVAEGFIAAKNSKEIIKLKEYIARRSELTKDEAAELEGLEKKYKANYLTGKRCLPTHALTEDGIDFSKCYILEEEFFYRSSKENKRIFKGPHLLIREKISGQSIPIGFTDNDLSFKDSIIGIHAPKVYRDDLLEIVEKLKGNRAAAFFAVAFSSKHMLKRGAAAQKEDIMNIPYPVNFTNLELSEIEEILVDDVLTYMLDFREKGEKAAVLEPVEHYQLESFGKLFCKILNTVYEKFKIHEPVVMDRFACLPVYYGAMPQLEISDVEQFEAYLQRLIQKDMGSNLRTVRVIRIYDENVIYLIKPRQLRYWLKSIAVRDADETFEDLVKQGY